MQGGGLIAEAGLLIALLADVVHLVTISSISISKVAPHLVTLVTIINGVRPNTLS